MRDITYILIFRFTAMIAALVPLYAVIRQPEGYKTLVVGGVLVVLLATVAASILENTHGKR